MSKCDITNLINTCLMFYIIYVYMNRCQCPYSYMTMSGMETDCICDCAAHNNYCLRLKQGVDTFSLRDRGYVTNSNVQCIIGLNQL